ERMYGGKDSERGRFDEMVDEKTNFDKTGSIEIGQLEKESHELESDQAESKPVIRLINKLFLEAIRRKSSDIHIEPFETFTRIRLRIDGSLYEVMRLPPQLRYATPA